MNKSHRLSASLLCALALSACAPTSSNMALLKPDRLRVDPLPTWITMPALQKTSPQKLQEILSPSGAMKTTPLIGSTPASQPTKP